MWVPQSGIRGLWEPEGLGGRHGEGLHKPASRHGRQPGEEEGQGSQDKGNTVGKGTEVSQITNGVCLQNELSTLPFGWSRRCGLESRVARRGDPETMLWELVQPGAGGSLRGAVGLCLQPGPFQSVSGWSHGRLVYQMCPWQSPMRVWHFQEPRQVERRTEANRKEFSQQSELE